MATIFERISLICKSKVNSLLDKFEDPAELIDQTIIDAKKEYAESIKASSEVFAAEKKALADLQKVKAEKEQYEAVAERAVAAGNDDDARQALSKAAELDSSISKADARYLTMRKNADDLRRKLQELKDGIAGMEAKAAEIKSDMAIADATKKTSKISGAINANAFETFDRLAEKAEKERMSAEAMADYEDSAMKDEDAELLAKYAGNAGDPSVEDKLAALKAKMGKSNTSSDTQ